MKKPIRILIVAALAASAGGLGWWLTRDGTNDGDLKTYGNVDVRQVNLAFPVGGRLESLAVEEGDRVKAGQVLARLESGYLEDEVRLAEARLAAQRAILEKLEAGSRAEDIAAAKAEMARTEAARNLAQATFERQQALAKTSAASVQALDQAKAGLSESEAALRAAKAALDLVLAGPRIEDIAAARAETEAATATLETAKRRLADGTLRAPATGSVLTRVQEPGATLAPNAVVLTLSLNDPVWVRTFVSEPDLGRIHPGMAADIFTDSRTAPYHGQIGFISPVAEFTPKTLETPDLRVDLVYRLRVVVTDADQGLRQGMPVTVIFHPQDGT